MSTKRRGRPRIGRLSRSWAGMAAVIAAVTAVSFAAAPTALAASATPQSGSSTRSSAGPANGARTWSPQTIFAPSPEQQQALAAQHAQCAAPVVQRRGHWVCPDANPGLAHAMLMRHLATHAAAPTDSYCENSALNCWFVYGTAQASYFGGGSFGVGTQVLGSVSFEVDLTLNGGQIRSKPVQFSPTVDTIDTTVDGVLSNAKQGIPPNPDQSTVGTFVLGGTGVVVANTNVYWTPNGYVSFNVRYRTKAHVHAFAWSVAGQTGGWYAWQASPIAYTADSVIWAFHTAHPQDLNSPHNQAGYIP